MYQILAGLANFLKPTVEISNFVNRLHFRYTVALFFGCSLVVSSTQFFGDPIDCMSGDAIPSKILNSFCWTHSTFSLEDAWDKKVGVEIPYPGIDKFTPGEKRMYHEYYQWVCFFLFFLGVLYYVPRMIWKNLEGGRVKELILGLDATIMDREKRRESCEKITEYFDTYLYDHKWYGRCYVLSEILNFCFSLALIFLSDRFLKGQFSTYGLKVFELMSLNPETRADPLTRVFPRLSKCTFHKYGPSGDVQRHDSMCVLPLNIINEKIFVLVWFWMVILCILSGTMLIYRVSLLVSPQFRHWIFMKRCRLADRNHIRLLSRKLQYGDWFLLSLLMKNMNPVNFAELIKHLYYNIVEKSKIEDKNSNV